MYLQLLKTSSGSAVKKTFFMLNSTEHDLELDSKK